MSSHWLGCMDRNFRCHVTLVARKDNVNHANMLSCVVREMICKSAIIIDLSTHSSNRG